MIVALLTNLFIELYKKKNKKHLKSQFKKYIINHFVCDQQNHIKIDETKQNL